MPHFVLAAFVLISALRLGLRSLNVRHLRRHGHEVPPEFRGQVDARTLREVARYTAKRSRLGTVEAAVEGAVVAGFLFGGGLSLYDSWIVSLAGSGVGAAVLFFLGLHWAGALIGAPFRLYETFRIEERHGFNTTTPALWVSDLLKSEAVATVLLASVTAGALALIRWSPEAWWLWVWGFFATVTVLLMYVSPYVIEPLFFRFEPVRREELKEEIRQLMARAGLTVSRVLQVDASRRSRHSNAYFTGIGRVKRIVLFDTLLEQLDQAEILGVLAHEAGHWRHHHLRKRVAVTQALGLGALYLAFHLLSWEHLPHLVGVDTASLPARILLLGFLASLASFPATPLGAWLSRRQEWQADRFAVRLTGAPEALGSALVKLSRENLANLHPHPLYVWFCYSHPPIPARVRALHQAAEAK